MELNKREQLASMFTAAIIREGRTNIAFIVRDAVMLTDNLLAELDRTKPEPPKPVITNTNTKRPLV